MKITCASGTRTPRTAYWLNSFLLALGGMLALQAPARADAIDDGLLDQGRADEIMQYVRERGYKNVGVLRFEVKNGKGPATMTAGLLNSLMATRLENALIHVNDLKEPVGVTRAAGKSAASADPRAGYHSMVARQKLFQHAYPLAWGGRNVAVDAFLTGRVELGQDFGGTRVVIQCFDRKDAKLHEVLSYAVKTERTSLRDMGRSFVVSRSSLNLRARDGVIDDQELNEEAVQDVERNQRNGQDQPSYERLKEYLDVQILVNDAPAAISARDGDGKIDALQPNQKVTLKLTAKARMGLLVRVNGTNTLGDEKDERSLQEYSWWILDPNKEYVVRGFYHNGRVKPFTTVLDDEVDASELGDNPDRHGAIDFDVFLEKGGDVGLAPNVQISAQATSSLRKAIPRAATLAAAKKQVAGNLGSAAKNLSAKSHNQQGGVRSRAVIVGRGDEEARLETTTFPGEFHVASCRIFYK